MREDQLIAAIEQIAASLVLIAGALTTIAEEAKREEEDREDYSPAD
jgi:hypothetical protein